MKKFLLSTALLSLMAGGATAKNWLYEPEPDFGLEQGQVLTGSVTNVSPNGRYAVSNDADLEYHIGSIWCIDNPSDFEILPDHGIAYDVTDDGVAVGAFYTIPGDFESRRPGYFKNGEWTALPIAANSANEGMSAEARAISADAKYIGGHQSINFYDEDIDEYRSLRVPCLWTLNEESGEYDLTDVYADPRIANQGMFVTCMSDDGSILAGMLTCGAGSSTIPAMIKDGELIFWNVLETRELPVYFKDQLMGFDNYYFIDGHVDTSGYDFNGSFRNITPDGKIIGYRTIVKDIVPNAEGEGLDAGDLYLYGFSYDIATDEFTDSASENCIYLAASKLADGSDLFFSGMGVEKIDEYLGTINEYFDVDSCRGDAIAYAVSDNGKVVVGSTAEIDEMGNQHEYPMVIVLDEPINSSEVEQLAAESATSATAVYNINGVEVKNPTAPGLYIVKTADTVKKVIIK